jgi:hypothetical protein
MLFALIFFQMDLLFRLGVPTYVFTVEADILAVPKIPIGEKMPVDLGWVYGVSVNIAGHTATTGRVLPTSGQIGDLYLNLKYGQAIYVDQLRLSELVYTLPIALAAGAPQFQNAHRYMPLNIPMNTDLKLSWIQNPTLLADITVAINFYYIDTVAYQNLLNAGHLLANGISQKKG